MALRRTAFPIVAALALTAACGGDDPVGPAGGLFSLGQSVNVESGRDVQLSPGATDGEFLAVAANLAPDSTTSSGFTLRASGNSAVSASQLPSLAATFALQPEDASAMRPRRDIEFEDQLRERSLAVLTPRMAAARAWHSARIPAIPSTPSVGDLVTVNVNVREPCAQPDYHALRVVAIGTKALVLSDTLNPRVGGFTTADYQRYAARFDTLVYPMDVAAFGEPTDIDRNGHIAIVFTRAVNELTPRNSFSYVGGLAFTRDLFPQVATSRALACAASNEGEYFYLMTPDPSGTINGNRRTTGFVDSNTTAVIAHELQHLINSSRKLYVNTAAPRFEDKWLDEGLAHVAEELLFYRESGLAPRSNLTYAGLVSNPRARAAYLTDMNGNATRYQDYLASTLKSSAYAAGDSLATRGAAWSLLRYVADQSSSDGDIWSKLVNNTSVGLANLQSVLGRDVAPVVRDWMVSLALDDVAGAPASAQQKSWNWRSIYGGAGGVAGLYPLSVTPMGNATSYTGTVVAGGAAFYKLSVPANGTATLSLGGPSGAATSNLQLVIVRTK